MKTVPGLLLALLSACLLRAQSPAAEDDGENLLENGNFEKGTAGWELFNWGKDGRMEIDESELHDGKPTLRVDNLEAAHSFVRQTLVGKPFTHYRLTGFIKTKEVEPADKAKKTGAVLEVGRSGFYTPLLEKTQPWKKVTVEFSTDLSGEIRVGPSLGTDPDFVTGTAWFSDLQLVELDSGNLVRNGNFEQGTMGWELINWGKKGTMEIDEKELREGKPTLRVDNIEPCHSFIRQIIKGKPNTGYRLTGYIKTKDVTPADEAQKTGAVLMIGRRGIYTPVMEKTEPWKKVTVDFTTDDGGEIRVGPSLGTDSGFVTGTAWFSDLQIIELKGKTDI